MIDSPLTIEQFNKIYSGFFFIAFSQSDNYGRGDFILIDLPSGEIKLTCLNKEMADIPYLSDVPDLIFDYIDKRS